MKKKESETVPTDVTEILSAAVKGLEYPSESDAPFEIFGWDAGLGELTAESLAIVMQKGKKRKPRVEEVSFTDFFSALADSEDAERFKNVQSILTNNLSDLKVFRVGSTKVDIYIVGRSAEGSWFGLHTTSVET